ncbi:hypothetical protein INT43_008484 [Umbelopsis isabellina]|uniref:Cytochrome b5 heme-binding domain-containing protein n=1 Tax=Mortierella isabellina TaxID=91625 RepID=A0A8H7PWS6_MORIS|nr:hypothetical protein INT43_008484 [Umbelopsis isabellina]
MSAPLSLAQIASHNTKRDIYVAVHNKVYNITDFVEEVSSFSNVPGSCEIAILMSIFHSIPERLMHILTKHFSSFLGKDATESFEDIGHSDEAREILEKYYVADLDEASKTQVKKTPAARAPSSSDSSSSGSSLRLIVPILAVAGYFYYKYAVQRN